MWGLILGIIILLAGVALIVYGLNLYGWIAVVIGIILLIVGWRGKGKKSEGSPTPPAEPSAPSETPGAPTV